VLSHQHHGLQRFQLVAEHLALVGKGNLLLPGGTEPKELAHFIEGAAEACCRGYVAEPAHRIVALFDATMVLLQPIVEIRVATVHDLLAKSITDRTRVGVMSIRRHPLWCVTNDSNGLREKAPGGIHIPLLAQHRVNQVAIAINGTVKIAPFSPLDKIHQLVSMYFYIACICSVAFSLFPLLLQEKNISKISYLFSDCVLGYLSFYVRRRKGNGSK
jgi:hypothetical protein